MNRAELRMAVALCVAGFANAAPLTTERGEKVTSENCRMGVTPGEY